MVWKMQKNDVGSKLPTFVAWEQENIRNGGSGTDFKSIPEGLEYPH